MILEIAKVLGGRAHDQIKNEIQCWMQLLVAEAVSVHPLKCVDYLDTMLEESPEHIQQLLKQEVTLCVMCNCVTDFSLE